jgi:hypothetical protein
LFERYALYTRWHGRILRGELSHEPWRVRPATLDECVHDTVDRAGFRVDGDPHVFVGEPVNVTVYPMRTVGKRRP